LEQIFHTLQPKSEEEKRFVNLVVRREARGLEAFLNQRPDFPLNTRWFSFGKPALVDARNERAVAEVLLDHGADIDARSDWDVGSYGVLNETNLEMVQFFLQHGATLDIHAACEHNMTAEVEAFLGQDPDAVHTRGPDGQMPLHYAATPELAERLLQAGADMNARCLDHNSTAAQYAVKDREEVARLLVDRGAECDIFLACALGDLDKVISLTESDPSCLKLRIGEGNYDGHIYCWRLGPHSPHHVASDRGHSQVVQFLRKRLPMPERFLFDCWRADREAVRSALQHQRDLVEQLPLEKRRLVADAAWEDRTEAVRLMLEVGFGVDTPGDHQSTPLDRACLQGHTNTIECILEFNPSFTVCNEFGGVPLSAALWGAENWGPADHVGAARLLLEAGSGGKPEDDVEGDRGLGVLLAWMARAGLQDMVELLLEYGASPNAVSREGVPAVDLAQQNGHISVVKFLKRLLE
jgi:ankyrin repeat protein